jgi:hypothetical protein
MERNVLKKMLILVLALILLLLPLAARWAYFYEGRYRAEPVPRPDVAGIKASAPDLEPFADAALHTVSAPGTILVDLAHSNRVQMAELNVLQARLAARGHQLEPVQAAGDDSDLGLADQLQYARALVVISPGKDWKPDEIQRVQEFVDKGGRLLMVTDPSRYGALFDEAGDFLGLDDDVPHINDLAARFGLVFQADYLYNTVENEGNFRNIRLADFAGHELTQGLDQVVFYAAHSIVSEEPALIAAGGETRSSSSERAEDLRVATLAADGAVLALGDLTFMTEPYNETYDNDRLIANIAGFLTGAQRTYTLSDFPFFFGDQAHLVYTGAPLLDSDLLVAGSALQALFDTAGKELTVRQSEDETADTLFFGLYKEAEEVEPYLASAQVTLLITPTAALDQAGEPEGTPTPAATPQPASGESQAATPLVTPTLEITATLPPIVTPQPEITAEITPPVKNRIRIESLGEMVLTGTLLLFSQTDGERHVMVALADTETGLKNAIERLNKGDLEGCLLRETAAASPTSLALCPTGEDAPGDGDEDLQKPKSEPPTPAPTPLVNGSGEPVPDTAEPPEPPAGLEGRILVVALDGGQGRYDSMTGAGYYAAILEESHDVTVWSIAQKGVPDALDLLDYDLVIWTAGDIEDALGVEERELLYYAVLKGIPVIVSGAYIGDTDSESVQRDIQVKDASHPMADGFEPEEVISFIPAPSGKEYEIHLLAEMAGEENPIIFARGPDSEDPGEPSIFVIEDELSTVQAAFMGFPLYLIPEEARTRLVLNTVSWLLNP